MKTHRKPLLNSRKRGRTGQLQRVAIVAAAAIAVGSLLYALKPVSAEGNAAPDLIAALVGGGVSDSSSSQAFATAMTAATSGGREFVVAPLDNQAAAVSAHMVGEGSYQIARDENLQAKQVAAQAHYQRLRSEPHRGSVVAGLHALGQHLSGTPHTAVDVLLDGNVLQLTPGLNLTDPVLRGDVAGTVVKVASQLPDCHGWRFYVVGGSAVGGVVSDSVLDLQAQEVWRRLAKACGGVLAAWDGTQLGQFPSSSVVAAPAAAKACDEKFVLAGDVTFKTGSSEVSSSGADYLRRVAAVVLAHPGARVSIAGFTDNQGSAHFDNYGLSQDRADAVKAALAIAGVQKGHITAKGYGPERPVASNDTTAGRQQNRRVEITVQLAASDCQSRG
jgi:outer membrane protein OmpA-like peptidoglycan-associated protein